MKRRITFHSTLQLHKVKISVFIKKFYGNTFMPSPSCIVYGSFLLQWGIGIIVTETFCPQSLKYFLSGSLQKVCCALV